MALPELSANSFAAHPPFSAAGNSNRSALPPIPPAHDT